MATEIEKLERARNYLNSLSRGKDPISGIEISEDSVLNNERLIRCFLYVSDTLQKIIDNGGEINRRASKNKTIPFSISQEQMQSIEMSDEPLPISVIAERINNAVNDPEVAKISAVKMTTWLLEQGYLKESISENGNKQRVVTTKGEEVGITSEERINSTRGSYIMNLYNKTAQQFVVRHLIDIGDCHGKNSGD